MSSRILSRGNGCPYLKFLPTPLIIAKLTNNFGVARQPHLSETFWSKQLGNTDLLVIENKSCAARDFLGFGTINLAFHHI